MPGTEQAAETAGNIPATSTDTVDVEPTLDETDGSAVPLPDPDRETLSSAPPASSGTRCRMLDQLYGAACG